MLSITRQRRDSWETCAARPLSFPCLLHTTGGRGKPGLVLLKLVPHKTTPRAPTLSPLISTVCKTTKNFRQIFIHLASVRDVFQRQEIADSEANRGGETGSGQNIKAVGAESWTPLLRPHASLPWTLLLLDNATMPLKPLFTPFCHFAFGLFLVTVYVRVGRFESTSNVVCGGIMVVSSLSQALFWQDKAQARRG